MGKRAKELKVKKVHDDAIIPKYESKGASGFDLASVEEVDVPAGETKLISTGLKFEIPEGYELQIRPRSGLSYKTKLRVCNSPGTIDSDYRGEVKVLIENIDIRNLDTPAAVRSRPTIEKGDRIAQAVLMEVPKAIIIEEDENLSETERGDSGFGSTGK